MLDLFQWEGRSPWLSLAPLLAQTAAQLQVTGTKVPILPINQCQGCSSELAEHLSEVAAW